MTSPVRKKAPPGETPKFDNTKNFSLEIEEVDIERDEDAEIESYKSPKREDDVHESALRDKLGKLSERSKEAKRQEEENDKQDELSKEGVKLRLMKKVSEGSAKKTGKKLNEFSSNNFKGESPKKLKMLEDLENNPKWTPKRPRGDI